MVKWFVWLADYKAWENTAKVVWREEQLESVQVSSEELQPIRFQGQSFDVETGLHYNRFRYFDPDLGMFTTRDPIGLMGGSNTFQYAPNPTGWIDPFGLMSDCCSQSKNCDEILKDAGVKIGKHGEIKKIGGIYDSHHIYQDKAVDGITDSYNYNEAIAISIQGRISETDRRTRGTPHYKANMVQKNAGPGGLLGSETIIAYKSLIAAGLKPKVAKCAVLEARNYLVGIGANSGTSTLKPKNRK